MRITSRTSEPSIFAATNVPIGSGAPEEIEIRAAGVQAVERLVEVLRAAGTPATAHEVDHWLWHRGQRPEIKAHPRHRSRNTFY